MSNTPTSSEDLYWRLHGLSKILEGSGFIDESKHPDAYATILDAMAFVRGSQPVVLEPLTLQQIAKAFAEAGLDPDDYPDDVMIEPLVRTIERAHGIKQGGQHG